MIFLALVVSPNLIYSGGIVIAALIAAVAGLITARIKAPSENQHLEAAARESDLTAAQLAVQSIREALIEAQLHIETLKQRVIKLTEQIGELKGRLSASEDARHKLEDRLSLMMAEGAILQQRIIDLELKAANANGNGKPDAVLMADLMTGEIDYASDGVFSLLGYTPKELIGKTVNILVPEHLRAMHTEAWQAYAQHPRIRPMGAGLDLQGRKRDGSTVPLDISLHPTEDGRVLTLLKRKKVV